MGGQEEEGPFDRGPVGGRQEEEDVNGGGQEEEELLDRGAVGGRQEEEEVNGGGQEEERPGGEGQEDSQAADNQVGRILRDRDRIDYSVYY